MHSLLALALDVILPIPLRDESSYDCMEVTVKQKRFYYILMVTVLGLLMLATAAIAQESNRPGQIGTGVLVLGQPFVPTGVKDATAADGVKQILPASNAAKLDIGASVTPAVTYVYKVRETFEGSWPSGKWSTYDRNGATGGQVCWNDNSWIHFRGHWSGASAAGCANGIDPYTQFYPNNMNSWMVNGPFSTVGAKSGQLNFKYWNQSEYSYDYLWWCVSPDNIDYYCFNHTGDSHGWKTGQLNLKSVPGYGNMLGDPSVWAAWVFTSDGTYGDNGGFVDNAGIVVKK